MGLHEQLMTELEKVEASIDYYLNSQKEGAPPFNQDEFNKLFEPPPSRTLFYIPGEPWPSGGKTLNFERMGRCLYWCWAQLHGTNEEVKESESLLLEFLKLEDETGIMSKGNQCEQLCSDPHFNFHLYPMLLVYEILYIRNVNKNPTNFFDAVSGWITKLFNILKEFASPAGRIVMPGTRNKYEDDKIMKSWENVTTGFREFFGIAHTGNAKDPNHGIWNDYRDFASSRVIRKYDFRDKFKDMLDNLLPKLFLKCSISFFEKGQICSIEKADVNQVEEVIDFTVFRYKDEAMLDFGRAWLDEKQRSFKYGLGRLLEKKVL